MRRLTALALGCCALFSLARPAAAYTFLNIPDRVDYAFGGNGLLYVSTAGGSVVRYNTITNTTLTPFTPGGTLRGLDVSPDGTTLAVADRTTQNASSHVHLINTATGVDTQLTFAPDSYEDGTYMVAWGDDGRLLTTSKFAGSGDVPLRRYDPGTGVTTTLGKIWQNTMLTASADRRTIAFAEANISSGPSGAYDVTSGAIQARAGANWNVFDVAVTRNGDRLVVPSFNGAYVYDRSGSTLTEVAKLGKYNDPGPVGAIFSPIYDVLFTAECGGGASTPAVRAYNAKTLALIATIDATYNFGATINALGDGRMDISPDGKTLAVSVANGVRVYDVSAIVPEPTACVLAGGAALGLLRRHSRT